VTHRSARSARVVAAALLVAHPVAGQSPYATSHFVPRAGSTAVAVSLRMPHGSSGDESGMEGTADLVARVLAEQVARSLERWGTGTVTSRVGRTSLSFDLLTTPETWRQDLTRMDSVLFDAPIDVQLFERTRQLTLESLAFEEGSPVREYRMEVARTLAPPGSPWTRPPGGTSVSVGAMTPAALERYRGSNLRRAGAVVVVVGPQAPVPTGPDSTRVDPAVVPSEPPDDGLAWIAGQRVDAVRDVTSAWITIAYPAPRSAKRVELELLAFVLDEELDPTPPDPDRYSVEVRIEDTPGGPVIVAEAAVLPEAADRWEARIRGAVSRLAEQTMPADFFRLRLRRFRATRLLAESAPEVLAARIAGDLARLGFARDLPAEIRSLDASALSGAARSLGDPRVFRFGPDLGIDTGASPRPPRGASGRADPPRAP